MGKSPLRLLIVVAVTTGVALAAVAYARYRLATQDVTGPPAPLVTTWEYPTEQEWIVAHVVRAIVNMADYPPAGSPQPGAPEVQVTARTDAASAPAFDVAIPARRKTWRLAAGDYIWAPEMYAPIAADLLGPAPTASSPTPAAANATLEAMTRPRTDVMVSESRRVSVALAADMTDPGAQEDAALLLATLTLREYSGNFFENRGLLCRIAAHLAVSSAQRKGTARTERGPAGKLAEITLQTLAFAPQRLALAGLDALDVDSNAPPAVRAWSRTLRIRNTEDWRLLREPEKATLIERLECLGPLYWKVGSAAGLELLDKAPLEDMPDWGSRVLYLGATVEGGNRFVSAGPSSVLQDAFAMPLGLDHAKDPKALVDALNTEPGPGPVRSEGGRVVVEVLDPGTWAAFAQRHLLHYYESGVQFAENMLGQPEHAKQLRTWFERSFAGLRQLPFAQLRLAKDAAAYEVAMKQALALLAKRPDAVGGHNWGTMLAGPGFPVAAFAVPPIESWCTPLFPAGTYYEWPKRLWGAHGSLRLRGPELQRVREALPGYSALVRAEVTDRLGEHASASDLQREYGPLLDYDLNLLNEVIGRALDDPALVKRLGRQACNLNPDELGWLAWYLVRQGEPEAAAETYEEYVARARDRIAVSNAVEWLIDYHYDHGRKERAMALAQQAADVYSGAGLLTLARLYARMGRWSDAEAYYAKENERYDDEPILLGFYLRHQAATGDDRYRAPRERLLAKIFPGGLERTTKDPSGPPSGGVLILDSSWPGDKAGIKKGDVIVALDGFRVRTYEQYLTVRELTPHGDMRLTVWRGKQHVELLARGWHRSLGLQAMTLNGPRGPDTKYI